MALRIGPPPAKPQPQQKQATAFDKFLNVAGTIGGFAAGGPVGAMVGKTVSDIGSAASQGVALKKLMTPEQQEQAAPEAPQGVAVNDAISRKSAQMAQQQAGQSVASQNPDLDTVRSGMMALQEVDEQTRAKHLKPMMDTYKGVLDQMADKGFA